MQDVWHIKNKLGIKNHSSGPWQDGVRKQSINRDGTVGVDCLCGHWDLETDKFGYCRSEDCRYERLVKAFYNGEAMKLKDGSILWTPGVKLVKG